MTEQIAAIPLRTARLVLRPLVSSDADALVAIANDWDVVRMLMRLPFPFTLGDAAARIDWIVSGGLRHWAITLSGQLVGCVGTEGHLGYFFGRQYWGQGYAIEAATVALDHHFSDPKEHSIVSGAFEENTSSLRVLTKLGFIETSRSTRFSEARQAEDPHIDMRLDREVWRGRQELREWRKTDR